VRVLIDTTFACRRPHSGTAVYLDKLTGALRRIADVDVLEVANGRRRAPAGGGLGSARNLVGDRWWASVELPRLARRMGAELIHHPLPARTPHPPVPQVITVHDLAFERLPEHFDRAFRAYAHRSHRSAARAAAAVICVSETTAADVRELWGVMPERVVVAPHGPGQEVAPARADADAGEHFLYVGDAEPRKNLPTLIAAYRRYRELAPDPLPLILAGSAEAHAPGVSAVAGPDQAQLADLYGRAVALIQPSLYEGFGLTALEAMCAGTPVIAAETAGLREICGDAARYIDPRDYESLAEAMVQLPCEPRLRAELRARGLRRAADFSWIGCARAHVGAYSLALSNQ
jgi:glycosyltransferase involved in cell wall biosynthesis